MILAKNYKKFVNGGSTGDRDTDNSVLMSGIGLGTEVIGGITDAVDPDGTNPFASALGTGAKFAGMGAKIGGPIGAGVGAVIGGVAGLFSSGKRRREAITRLHKDTAMARMQQNNYSAASIANNPALTNGSLSAGYFKYGGELGGQPQNGALIQKSSDGMEVQGPSHANGGVKFPESGTELEGQETIKGDYVFSKELGFAKLHRPIMVAKGKIEKKPLTPDRVNSMMLLDAQENKLKAAQEYIRNILNVA